MNVFFVISEKMKVNNNINFMWNHLMNKVKYFLHYFSALKLIFVSSSVTRQILSSMTISLGQSEYFYLNKMNKK